MIADTGPGRQENHILLCQPVGGAGVNYTLPWATRYRCHEACKPKKADGATLSQYS